jgi:hypothetical protein
VSPPAGEFADGVLPDTVNGLPLHAMSVHSTVVLVPLAAVLGVLFAVPRLRAWARWPLALVGPGAAVATWVSMQSGERLERALDENGALSEVIAGLVDRHEELAEQLEWMVIGYAVVALAAALVVDRDGDRHAAGSEPPARGAGGSSALALVFSVLLVAGAVAVGVQTYRVGDAGAKAVWNPTGQIDYSPD